MHTSIPSLFVEHLTVIDCAYLCATRGLVGESWIVDVLLEGALDDASMIMDFGQVKKQIKRALDAWIDHTLVVPTHSPALTKQSSGPDSTQLRFAFADNWLLHTSPSQALCLLPAAEVSRRSVTEYLEARLRDILPATVRAITISLRTESEDHPYFQYVHGLKKHDGQCQRIAHGHRSRLMIARNGVPDPALSEEWASALHDRYLGTHEDIQAQDATHLHFAYCSGEGEYRLSYPAERCYILQSDSTIEQITSHLVTRLWQEHPTDQLTVRAYEGVMKGAVAQTGHIPTID